VHDVLQEADRAILALAGGSHYLLYRAVHRFASVIAPLDSFYIGFCREAERTIVYPYNFDGREYDDPNVNPYQSGGVTEWIVTHRRSYWSHTDNGELLHRGRAFGDTTRRSAEGIVVPIFERSGKRSGVSGLLSILSYTPNVYTKDMVGAIECLAESLGTALQREREDEARRHRHRATGLRGGMGETSIPNPPLVLDTVSERLKHIRQRAESLRHLIAESALSSDCAVLRAAEELAQECERSQTETLEMFLRTTTVAENPLARLTSREREVAILLVSGQSNRQIAERLFVSEKTAKTHVGNILQKLGTGGRSGVAQLLKPYLCLPTTPMA
jgi:DNA-binding CsgD family transcriptional regulator